MRFAKLLVLAWIGTCFAWERWPSAETLGAALAIALVTWFIIRKQPRTDFRLLSKPTTAVLIVAGLSGFGQHYGELEHSGLNPNQKFEAATLSIAGLLTLAGAIGLFILPSIEPPRDSREELQTDPTG